MSYYDEIRADGTVERGLVNPPYNQANEVAVEQQVTEMLDGPDFPVALDSLDELVEVRGDLVEARHRIEELTEHAAVATNEANYWKERWNESAAALDETRSELQRLKERCNLVQADIYRIAEIVVQYREDYSLCDDGWASFVADVNKATKTGEYFDPPTVSETFNVHGDVSVTGDPDNVSNYRAALADHLHEAACDLARDHDVETDECSIYL